MLRQAVRRNEDNPVRWWHDSLSCDRMERSPVTTSVARNK